MKSRVPTHCGPVFTYFLFRLKSKGVKVKTTKDRGTVPNTSSSVRGSLTQSLWVQSSYGSGPEGFTTDTYFRGLKIRLSWNKVKTRVRTDL